MTVSEDVPITVPYVKPRPVRSWWPTLVEKHLLLFRGLSERSEKFEIRLGLLTEVWSHIRQDPSGKESLREFCEELARFKRSSTRASWTQALRRLGISKSYARELVTIGYRS